MPQVPEVPLPRQAMAPLPGPRASGSSFGASVPGPDVSGVRDELAARYQDEVRFASQSRVLRAAGELSTAATDVLTGIRSTKGDAAAPALDAAKATWDQVVERQMQGLATDEQRLAVQNIAQQHWAQVYAQGSHHVAQEADTAAADALAGAVNGAKAQAAAAVTNGAVTSAGERALQTAADQLRVAYGWAKARGLATDEDERQAVSDLHSTVLTRLLDSGATSATPDAAIKYFEAHADTLTDAARLKMDSLVMKRTGEALAHQHADAIWAEHATLEGALHDAEQVPNPQLRDLVKSELRSKAKDEQDSRRDAAENAYRNLSGLIANGARYTSLPVGQRALLSGAQQLELMRLSDRMAHPPRVTDRPTYAKLMNQAQTDPASFAKTDLNAYAPHLSDGDFKRLADLQAKARAAKTSGAARAAGPLDRGLRGTTPPPGGPLAPKPPVGLVPVAPNTTPKTGRQTGAIPDEWRAHADTNPEYAAYLTAMGVDL